MTEKKEPTIPLSAMHCAMVYRLIGQEPPEDIADFRGPPSAAIAARLAYARKVDPERAVEFTQQLGYGSGSCGPLYDIPVAWVRGMLSRGTGRVIQATKLEKPLDSVGYDGLTEGERVGQQLAEIYKEGERAPEPLSPPDLE